MTKTIRAVLALLLTAALAFVPAIVEAQNPGSKAPLPAITILMGLPPLVAPTGGCPGGSGGSSGFCAVQTDLPNLSGIMIQIYWSTGQVVNGTDLGIGNTSTQGSYSWTNFDTTIENYTSQSCGANLLGGAHGCYVALVDGSATNQPDGNPNTNTPRYVATQAYADAGTPAWAPGTYSENLDVLYQGTYYTQASGGTCTDVTFGSGCTWSSTGAHAAPQNFTFSNAIPGTTNANWPVTTTANINSATACGGSQCTSQLLVAGFPAPETPILMAKKAFRAALLAHIAAAPYASQVVYLRVCIGEGGENWSRNYQQLELLVGNNQTRMQNQWLEYLYLSESLAVSVWKTSGVSFPLDGSFEGGNFGLSSSAADTMASYAASLNMGMGQQGIETPDIANFAAGTSCNNDWCHVMQTYPNSPLFEMQSVQESDPSNVNGAVGSLVYLLPLYALLRGHSPIYFEAWSGDLRCAYESGYTDSNCTSGFAPDVAYQNLFQQLQAGVPAPFGIGLAGRTK
jgi:hypothetical protein